MKKRIPLFFLKNKDDEGVYYWHKRTGTVTRERPDPDIIIDSPSSTLSSSSSNDFCFESNSFVSKSESNSSIKVDHHLNFLRRKSIRF